MTASVLPVGPGPWIAPTRAVAHLSGLAEMLGRPLVRRTDAHGAAGVLAWGYKPSAALSARVASRHGLPLLRIEDGFLRSVGLGGDEPPLSIVVDDFAIYYDASAPSRLERLIALPRGPAEQARARDIAARWRAGRLSKYNHGRELTLPDLELRLRRRGMASYVLVADQTVGDDSIRFGAADARCFLRMLQTALDEHPDCAVLLKIHPDVVAGRKRGHFDLRALAANPRVVVVAEPVHPVSLIEHARAVYVVTSQLGFEALLWGKPVRTFGMPFYAGWGLTDDELSTPPRRMPVPLENLIHAALVDYPLYLDPERHEPCGVERLMEWMTLQRRMRERFPPVVHAVGFSLLKRPLLKRFLQGSTVAFVRDARRVPGGATLAVWGSWPAPGRLQDGVATVRVEDGFLRSVGLGADLVRPLSWVMDREGIYYDATHPSELERMLQHRTFDPALLQRARALREAVVHHGVTKYNVGEGAWRRPATAGRPVLLVAGQVERDASIRYGGLEVRTNLALLQAVRRANPEAWLVYKPHPDVRAGLRDGGDGAAARWCDEIAADVPLEAMFGAIDELHVVTSLAGFEALLRGVPVVTWGAPFYAGWGLTRDMAAPARRTRRLSLDELVAGALLEYPAYVSRTTGRFTTAERALEELLAWRAADGSQAGLWRRLLRPLLRVVKG